MTAEGTVPAGRNAPVLVVFTALTNLADGVTKVALPLWATRLSGDPGPVTAVSLSLTLPWLLFALHTGVLVDRVDRRRLLWAANSVRLFAVGGLAAQAATDGLTIGRLCAGGAVLGVAEVVALTAAAAMVPSVVPRSRWERTNTWVAGAETVCNEMCGPYVGGLLVSLGIGFALGTTGAAYAAAGLVLLLLTGRFRAGHHARGGGSGGSGAPVQETVHAQISGGLGFLWRHPLLRTMALTLTVLCACWGAWLALMPLYATQLMGLDADAYGAVLAALGLGGLAGALFTTRLNALLGRRWAMFIDLAGTFTMMAVPVLTTDLRAVAAAAFVGGAGGTLWRVNARTIGQHVVPEAMLGRYSAAHRLFSWGAAPLGAGLVGLLAEWGGLRFAFVVFALAAAAVSLPFLRSFTPDALDKVFDENSDGSVPSHSSMVAQEAR